MIVCHFVIAYRWITRTGTQSLPENAIFGGRDSDGSKIYVGRAFHNGDTLPAKVIPDKNVAYVCYNGEEHPKDNFEVSKKKERTFLFLNVTKLSIFLIIVTHKNKQKGEHWYKV